MNEPAEIPPPPKRECGGCTLCCKLVGVTQIAKPRNKWCGFCTPGVGCQVHEKEHIPASCDSFACAWLMGIGSDAARPDKTKVVLITNGERLSAVNDPSSPGAWREGEIGAMLRQAAKSGTMTMVVTGNRALVLGPKWQETDVSAVFQDFLDKGLLV